MCVRTVWKPVETAHCCHACMLCARFKRHAVERVSKWHATRFETVRIFKFSYMQLIIHCTDLFIWLHSHKTITVAFISMTPQYAPGCQPCWVLRKREIPLNLLAFRYINRPSQECKHLFKEDNSQRTPTHASALPEHYLEQTGCVTGNAFTCITDYYAYFG